MLPNQRDIDRDVVRNIFKNATVGGWWDARDLSTLFTDTAGTTRVKAAAESVKLWQDKSGLGNHVSEETNPPSWQTDNGGCVRFNGTSQFLSKASTIDLYNAGACSCFAAVKANPAINSILWSTASSTDILPRYYLMQAETTTATTHVGFIRNGAGTTLLQATLKTLSLNNTVRVIGAIDNGVTVTGFLDSEQGTPVTYTARTGTVVTDRFSIGALYRATAAAWMAMDLYELVIIGRVVTVAERQAIIRYLGRPRGRFF